MELQEESKATENPCVEHREKYTQIVQYLTYKKKFPFYLSSWNSAHFVIQH